MQRYPAGKVVAINVTIWGKLGPYASSTFAPRSRKLITSGIIAMSMAASKDFGGLAAARFVLGLFEALTFPVRCASPGSINWGRCTDGVPYLPRGSLSSFPRGTPVGSRSLGSPLSTAPSPRSPTDCSLASFHPHLFKPIEQSNPPLISFPYFRRLLVRHGPTTRQRMAAPFPPRRRDHTVLGHAHGGVAP